MELSVIIVSFNTKELLRKCIDAVKETLGESAHEIIIVDNFSTDGSPAMIETEYENVILLKNKSNVGFAKANNQAVKIARGKYILLLNSDAFVSGHCIEALIQFMDSHPRAAAVGPKVLNKDGTLQSKGHIAPSIIWSLIKLFGINMLLPLKIKYKILPKFYWDEDTPTKVDWLSGCCILLSSDAINVIGRLSEEYFLYYEETDWCHRARKNKYEIWYEPRAVVSHVNRASPNDFYDKHLRASKLIYFRKSGKINGVAISFITLLTFVIRYIFIAMIRDDKNAIMLKDNISEEWCFLKDIMRFS